MGERHAYWYKTLIKNQKQINGKVSYAHGLEDQY